MSDTDMTTRVEKLSLEKRALLFQQLQKKREGEKSLAIKIPRQSRDSHTFPLSFAQQRLWFLDQYEPNSPQYNMPYAIQMTGHLNLEVLQQAIQTIIARHESLRTTFTTVNDEAVQVIAEPGPANIPLTDLRHLPDAERKAEARRMAAEEAQRPFDLTCGPLIRTALLRLNDDEHVLLLTLHHIVSDGWSHGIFMHELATLYEAFSAGKPSPLAELPIQYVDFALWQRQWLQGEVLEKQLSYWKQQLANTPALDLPTDRPRPAIRTYRGTMETLLIPESLAEAIRALTQREQATLFMTLLAAFQTLLYRYSGQSDIPVGTMIANRRWAEVERLIGFFANTLTFRTDLSGNPTFRELLQRVRPVILDAYDHQDLPFEKLVDELRLKRDTSRTPLFQVMFILHNVPSSNAELPGLALNPMEADSRTAKFDMTLYITDTHQGLAAEMEYNTDLFDAATVRRMLGHLHTILEGITANPDQRITELPLLTAAERAQLLTEWNNTRAVYPKDQGIHERFEAQVKRNPGAAAVLFEDQILTYAELNERANQLAHYLQGLGVKPGVFVGICMERSPEIVVALLGILKAGGTYVPLDPNYPQERLSFMLQDARLPVLLTHSRHATTSEKLRAASSTPITIVSLDADREAIEREKTQNPVCGATAQNLAYVIYTSGSTGQPKGVQIPHYAVVNFLTAMQQQPGLTEQDTLVAVTTLSFDIAGLELYLPLIVGGRVVIASREVASDGEQLSALLARSNATAMQATPATWRLLLGAGWQGHARFQVLCGGEALSRELANQLVDRSAAVWNLYGPTEATIWSAICPISSKEGMVSIGQPIANTQIHLLDAHLQIVPAGIPGELHIGGDGLSWGYLNRTELTAEKFIPHPYSQEPGARLYKTGDLARYLADGRIEFLGRIDYQVKVRGFRIELGEIETALAGHPAIRQAVVIAREDVPGDKRLVAYAVANQEQAPTVSDLRRFLKEKLPDYMAPAAFVLLDAMPLTPNGKVDRRALPAPDSTRPELKEAYVAPRTPAEQALAQIWADLLKIERVGVHDNFFELGGDSLLVIRVVSRAAQAGLTLTTKQFFQHQTIAELAAAAGKIHIQAEQGLVTGLVPLTFSMHRFFELNHPNPHYHTLSFLLETREPIEPARLEKAIEQLLLYHDSFRVRMVSGDAGRQLVNDGPSETVPFMQVDLSELSEEEQPHAMEAAHADVATSLNLFEGSLFRSIFFTRESNQSSYLLVIGHYLTADVLSWQMAIADLEVIYRQLERGEPVKLPPKTTSIKQWTERITAYAQSPEILKEVPYWLAEPRKHNTPLPIDFPGGANTVDSSRYVWIAFNVKETEALLAAGKAYNTQIHAVLLTAITRAFWQWTGSRSLLFELYGLGRESPFEDVDLSRTIGWLTFSYPMLLDLGAVSSLGEELKSVAKQLKSIPNYGIGYPSLRYIYHDKEIAKRLRALPEPEMFFNFFGMVPGGLSMFRPAGGYTGHHHDKHATRHRPIAISGVITKGQLQLEWEYSENLHRQATIENVVHNCEEALRAIMALKPAAM